MQLHSAFLSSPPLLVSSFSTTFTPFTPFTSPVYSPSPRRLRSLRASLAPPHPYPKTFANPKSRHHFISTCASIPSVFLSMAEDPRFSSLTALIDNHHGPSVSLTFRDLGTCVRSFAKGLRVLGLRPGDVVSFFSENSHRWLVTDLALMAVGAAAAVRGVAAPVPELKYIYSHSGSTAMIVENVKVLKKIMEEDGLEGVKWVVVLFGEVEDDWGVPVYSYDYVMNSGERIGGQLGEMVGREDVATILYTSGTTGYPKGVPLTHGNLLTQLEDISLGGLDPVPEEVFVSVLPCWHVFERTAGYWSLTKGVTLVYSNKRRFRSDLVEHKPHFLISVPRVFENLHAAIVSKLESASVIRKAVFGFCLFVSTAFIRIRRRLNRLSVADQRKRGLISKLLDAILLTLLFPLHGLADKLVWTKLRGRLGGRLRMCLSGGGSIAGYLEDFFECAGIIICVGYGMTETSPVVANRFGEHNVRGSTGIPLPRAYTKIVNRETGKIVEHGESGSLMVAGPYVFSGYLKNQKATDEAFDSEGYFDTGDLAFNTIDGDIVIAGRSKDVIVLSNGENIEPGPIEDAVLASPLVDQVMLVGQDERALGALVVPKLDYMEREGLLNAEYRDRLEALIANPDENADELRKQEVELLSHSEMKSALSDDITRLNQERPNYTTIDSVRHVRLILVPFTVENGMATQTLKIKKNIVAKKYGKEIAEIYKHR